MNPKLGPRAEHRQQESLRIRQSPSLSEHFRSLTGLTVIYTHSDPEGIRRNHEIRYTVNLANARAMFWIDCPNCECVSGDFDLSAALARAVAMRQPSATGEVRCRGWLNRHTIGRTHCNNLLHYTLALTYKESGVRTNPSHQNGSTLVS